MFKTKQKYVGLLFREVIVRAAALVQIAKKIDSLIGDLTAWFPFRQMWGIRERCQY